VADETLTLTPQGAAGQYLVSALQTGPLHAESSGPHVISVTSAAGASGATLITVAFDSDLDASTVPQAFTLSAGSQSITPDSVQYNADARTVTLTVHTSASLLTLQLSTALRDIDEDAFSGSFTATVPGSSSTASQ
jgi:hypothetical protein